VVDTTKPTLSNVPADQTVECDNVPPPANVTASDLCDPDVQVELGEGLVILESNPPASATACTYEITRTWTATDDCGNTATATQKLTVHDSTSPTVVSCPADDTIQCPNAPQFGTPQFSDNCDTDLTITHNDVETPSPTCAQAKDVTRTWTAKDNCNNQVTCSQTIHIVDTTKPVLANVPADARPPKGMCRIWIDGVPAAQQPAATDCPTAIKNRPENAQVLFGNDFADSSKTKSGDKPKLPPNAKGFTDVKPLPQILPKRPPES